MFKITKEYDLRKDRERELEGELSYRLYRVSIGADSFASNFAINIFSKLILDYLEYKWEKIED